MQIDAVSNAQSVSILDGSFTEAAGHLLHAEAGAIIKLLPAFEVCLRERRKSRKLGCHLFWRSAQCKCRCLKGAKLAETPPRDGVSCRQLVRRGRRTQSATSHDRAMPAKGQTEGSDLCQAGTYEEDCRCSTASRPHCSGSLSFLREGSACFFHSMRFLQYCC